MAPKVRNQDKPNSIRRRESLMFMILFVVLLVAWLLGWFTLHAAGGLIHVLLVVAVIFLVIHFVRGRA
jgi:Family of unknown function (DUF5670)